MLEDLRLFRRHSRACARATPRSTLSENDLTHCECAIGYKYRDPIKGIQRQQFTDHLTGEKLLIKGPWLSAVPRATKLLEQIQADAARITESSATTLQNIANPSATLTDSPGVAIPVPTRPRLPSALRELPRITIKDAFFGDPKKPEFSSYCQILRSERELSESTIVAACSSTAKIILQQAEKLGYEYMDQLGYDFAARLMTAIRFYVQPMDKDSKEPAYAEVCSAARKRRRAIIEDFFRIAKLHAWTSVNICERLEPQRRRSGGDAKPKNPTQPFSLDVEVPKLLDGIRMWDRLPTNGLHRAGAWRKNPKTAEAFLLTLYYSGLRYADTLVRFDPMKLQLTIICGNSYWTSEVWQHKTKKYVRIYIPKADGELIRSAPRFGKLAFTPDRIDPDSVKGMVSWKGSTWHSVLKPLERMSGVAHIHAHRFRDTLARLVWEKTHDMRYVAERLGDTVDTVVKHYWYFMDEDRKAAEEKFFASPVKTRSASQAAFFGGPTETVAEMRQRIYEEVKATLDATKKKPKVKKAST